MKKNKVAVSVLQFLKNLFTKNILLKLLSLLFAMIIWGYVMTDQNPVRTKTVAEVPVNFEGESDLIARRLVVRSDRSEALKNITVRVDTELTKYADLDANDVTASISLRNVNGPGIYTLPINVTSADGNVLGPVQEVTIEIDNLDSTSIPLEIKLFGELPAGYWNDDPLPASNYVKIEGAAKDIASVAKAVCTIDVTDRKRTYNESTAVELQNSAGEAVNVTLLGQIPSVPVKLTILRMAELPINLDAAILGADELPVNYEIVTTSISPSSMVTVIGEADLIDSLSGIDIETIDVSGQKESVEETVALLLPEGVTSLNGDTVDVRINIRQSLKTLSFAAIPVEVRGLGSKLAASVNIESTDIEIEGRIGLMNELSRDDVVLYADVKGMNAGTYQIELRLELPKEEMLSEVTYTIRDLIVAVTLRNK